LFYDLALFAGRPAPAGVMPVMDPSLLGRLVDEHAAALALYARSWCAAPDDVVQEAFIKLAAQRPPPANPVGWLYRAVRNGAVSAGRSERRRRRHEAGAAAEARSWFLPSEGAALDGAAATAALAQLPTDLREPLVAHLWGGLSFEQIATLAGYTTSTAHRRYLAGLEALRERLRVACPNPI
jgi:RNA polymerase sigma-70 factor (ECF subfamily)